MQRDERLVGVLYVAGTDQARPFSDDDMALLQGVPDQAAQAIADARLFTEAERRLAYLQALHAIDMATSASLDLRLVFHVVLDGIIAQLRVDAAAILLFDEVALCSNTSTGAASARPTSSGRGCGWARTSPAGSRSTAAS